MSVGMPGKPLPKMPSEQKKQDEALKKLMKEREALSKKLGHWPSDSELMKSRKGR